MNLKIDQIGTEEKISGRTVRFSLLIRPEDQLIFDLRGRLAAVFEIDTTGSKVEKKALKKVAEDIFLQNYFVKSFFDNEGGLKETLRKIEQHFESLDIKKISYSGVIVLKDYIYMTRKGNCSLAFYRGGNLLGLKGITSDASKMQFSSGKALESDVLGLVAGHLEKELSFKDYLNRLQGLDPVENVAVFLYFEENGIVKSSEPTTLSSSNNILSNFQSRIDIWKQNRSKAIYIKSGMAKSSLTNTKNIVWKVFLIILVLLLLGSTVFTIYKTRQSKRSNLLGAVLGESTARLSEAEELVGLNNQKVRDILIEIESNLKESQKLANKDQAEKIDNLYKRISLLSDKTNNVTRLFEEDIFYDLGLKEFGITGSFACSMVDNLVIADSRKRLWVINYEDDLKVNILDQKTYPTLVQITCTDDAIYPAGTDFVDKVVKAESEDDSFEFQDNILGEDKEFKGFSAFFEYVGNLYFLKSDSNEIIKYTSNKEGYSDPSQYLDEDQDVSQGTSLAIDGDIYVAKKDLIEKYTAGSKILWELQNIPELEIDFGKIYTNSSLSNIYVLNKASNEVWVFDKQGYYQRLVKLENGGVIEDFSVGDGFLFVISGSKVYKLDL